ncbi:MAG TPA: LLM class flavin-dependent oxidoreductase [Candidatus Limnocylindria bacterium]|jgi:alkanesulfonate monooxygenase SsuD/methylene tetrahydromethanopterin reductase-like flavin-dependent oxidoreductase (luciferase family)|nr:LLM class flavin-dependent oxidoreductase [Candidatus Limnocylindria bacterium]
MSDAPPGGVKLGLLLWNQYTTWPQLRAAGIRADELGYDEIFTWDHLYPIVGSHEGPMLEAYMVMAAWSEVTSRAGIGLMVGANTFRNPALVAKMITTLDHISEGRAILGIGGAWFETEHRAFGIEFGGSPGERLRWLDEAARIMRGMLHGEQPSGERYYTTDLVRNDPPPVQRHVPLLIGGGGVRRTLRTVARYGDWCNVGGGFESVKQKDEILRRHCQEVGRDESEIERTTNVGVVVIRDDPAEAQRVLEETFRRNGNAPPWTDQPIGTPEQVAEKLRPYLGIGFRHFSVGCPAPYDAESMERLMTEVKPMLAGA